MKTKINTITAIVSGVIAVGLAQEAQADLVTDGTFQVGTVPGQLGYNASLTDWTYQAPNNSYDFVYTPATLTQTGVLGQDGLVGVWSPTALPGLGNVLGVDPDFQNAGGNLANPVSQMINGLTPGHTYVLTFWWAAAQQYGFNGATTEAWEASLGGTTQETTVVSLPSDSFGGWNKASFDYTATSSSELLSFIAYGTGGASLPPFCLLGDVSLTAPDATSTVVLLSLATSAMGFAARFRRQCRK